MTIDEIIKKRTELNFQIQELVNNFYKETDTPIEGIDVAYNCSYTTAREEYARKYIIKAKLKNPFD